MTVEILNLKKVRLRFGRLIDVFTKRSSLEEVGNYVIFRIKERTLEGKDVKGIPFAPYSPKYKMWRKKWGYETDKVDLTLTGGMLNAMTYEVSSLKKQVRVYFMPGTSRKARGQTKKSSVQHSAKAYYLQQKRKFFALSNKDEEKIRRIYEDSIREAWGRG